MGIVRALAANDLKSVGRDSLLLGVFLTPWLQVLFMRLLIPPLAAWLHAAHRFDLGPYIPLIASLLFLVNIPLLIGGLAGFMVLDERDEDTLTALRVTPMAMSTYLAYRTATGIGASWLMLLVALPLSGLMPLSLLPAFVAIALSASLFVPAIALALVGFAGNKLEGLALMKGMGALVIGALIAYFVQGPWQLAFGLLPTYGAAKAYWVAEADGNFWPYVAGGALYAAALACALFSRFRARL